VAVRVKKTQQGTKYMALYRTTTGKQKSAGTFDTRREAEGAYLEAISKVMRGIDPSAKETTVYPSQIRGSETVSAFADRWLPQHELSSHAREVYEWVLARKPS
jgi:hypothetical protein